MRPTPGARDSKPQTQLQLLCNDTHNCSVTTAFECDIYSALEIDQGKVYLTSSYLQECLYAPYVCMVHLQIVQAATAVEYSVSVQAKMAMIVRLVNHQAFQYSHSLLNVCH